MTISDEAVEAAAKAAAKDEDASNWHDESEYYRNGWRNRMQVGIEAAAAFIRAQALEDAAERYTGDDHGLTSNGHVRWWLGTRAVAERGVE